jgi:DNA-binding LytR/AlgR family response regulator
VSPLRPVAVPACPVRLRPDAVRGRARRVDPNRLGGPGLREAIDPDDIYFVEATGDDTRVRMRAARALRDVRPIGELEAPFLRQGFLRIHRNYLVNPRHVREVRRRSTGDDWELKLDPPVNLVLPVSRSALSALWAAFGEE